MRRVLVTLLLGAILVPMPAAAQSVSPSPEPPPTFVCIAVTEPGPWNPGSLMAALLTGATIITQVVDSASCPPPPTPPVAVETPIGTPVNVDGKMLVTVSKVAISKPRNGQRVFAFFVEYEGLEGGHASEADWSAYSDGELLGFAYTVPRGMKLLSSGDVPPGHRASGWVVSSGPGTKGTDVELTYGISSRDPAGKFTVTVPCCANVNP